MNTSKNFICKLPDTPEVVEALKSLRVVFNPMLLSVSTREADR